ncbi:hypothetical protein G7Y89_g5211 [Cudoniella acicularis]|uniref:Homeobox domain-containing protein n=1 Tax=Cudoniella acicularis TaxID=354080 RepID=A0A8H4W405_9HELO|nr:hypothetical protein G7Y89_g5211 [Cudoniella acicularis]
MLEGPEFAFEVDPCPDSSDDFGLDFHNEPDWAVLQTGNHDFISNPLPLQRNPFDGPHFSPDIVSNTDNDTSFTSHAKEPSIGDEIEGVSKDESPSAQERGAIEMAATNLPVDDPTLNEWDHHQEETKSEPPQNKKRVPRFSQSSVLVLRNWLSTNKNSPYPSEEEKDNLSWRTGLSKTQVTTWLANARRRARPVPNASIGSFSKSSPRDIINRPSTPALQMMNPFERWRSSPPEDDHAAYTDIVNAISTSCTSRVDRSSGNGYPDGDFSTASQSVDDASSTRSLDHRSDSDEERTFYRQDHLRQHLKLLHNSKFQACPMENWKVEIESIKSKCGFCDEHFDSWSGRVDHLASHFAAGSDMAEWQGGWGFEPRVQELVENGVPPYLIHVDRRTLLPFFATKNDSQPQRTTYDLVKLGLINFFDNHALRPQDLTHDELKLEVRRILASLSTSPRGNQIPAESWFHDLFLEDENPSRTINGGTPLAETPIHPQTGRVEDRLECPQEKQLLDFAARQKSLGKVPTDVDLQLRAFHILADMESNSSFQSHRAVSWFRHLIMSSRAWIRPFRKRAMESTNQINGGTSLHHVLDGQDRSVSLDAMEDHGNGDFQPNFEPTHEFTSEDLPNHGQALYWDIPEIPFAPDCTCDTSQQVSTISTPATRDELPRHRQFVLGNISETDPTISQPCFLSDTNSYQRLRYELLRYVASCLSLNNPARHIPSDAEIQNQARWIIFDDDDPWNQTAADCAQWMTEFKQDAGLL